MALTEQQAEAIRKLADIIEETAREAGPMGAPSGVVYAALMGVGITLDTYQSMLGIMEQQGRITVSSDLIKAVAR